MTFQVPEIPRGTHNLIVKEADSSLKVTTSFTIVPQLNLLDYIYRDHYYQLEGDGFGESASISLMMREKTGGAGIDKWPTVSITDEYFST